jgi:L,D-peptidoglycan transpeptidase YkuD (ErfK/YbiS/YcfS/YnhG family)
MDVAGLAGPTKHEGDDKAPAGIFRLGTSFGYSARSPSTRMPYLHLTNNIVAVDDSKSRYYNQLVDTSKIKGADWRTAENMILGDDRYKWGLVVLHNVPPTPGVGSCIFLHVWKDASTATSGCTAMSQNTLVNLLHWLDPAKSPRLIQLPRSIYKEMREGWTLPPM